MFEFKKIKKYAINRSRELQTELVDRLVFFVDEVSVVDCVHEDARVPVFLIFFDFGRRKIVFFVSQISKNVFEWKKKFQIYLSGQRLPTP